MAKHDYRADARDAAKRARELMGDAKGDLSRLRYAALEARLAMEALTYGRAQVYRDELASSEIGTWQPRKLLIVLLNIDPMADKSATLRIGKNAAKGAIPSGGSVRNMGTEVVLDLKFLRNYDKLGAFLHAPTLKQLAEGAEHDATKLRRRLNIVLTRIDEVLASPIFNLKRPCPVSSITCGRCGEAVRRRMPPEIKRARMDCQDCGAPYTIIRQQDDSYIWWADDARIVCPVKDCDGEVIVPTDQIVRGAMFDCPKCAKTMRLVMFPRPARETEKLGLEP